MLAAPFSTDRHTLPRLTPSLWGGKRKILTKKIHKKKIFKKKTFQVSCAFLQLQEFSQRNQTWEHHPSTFAARLFLRLHTTY
jgi:pterin-4a-carbinolamine dehydratase